MFIIIYMRGDWDGAGRLGRLVYVYECGRHNSHEPETLVETHHCAPYFHYQGGRCNVTRLHGKIVLPDAMDWGFHADIHIRNIASNLLIFKDIHSLRGFL